MRILKRIEGYDLEDVANEMASTYGGTVDNWYTKDGKLIVEYTEYGEQCVCELPLSEVKSFMEM